MPSRPYNYVVILDRLQGRSGALEQALELQIRGPLTVEEEVVGSVLVNSTCQTLDN